MDSTQGHPVPSAADEPADSLFPFPRVRDGQREFLADARVAVSEGRHLLAHAPTGIGKTAVALTAALERSLPEGRLVLFLTSKQSQHWLAVETLRRIRDRGVPLRVVDVIAKQAMCLQDTAASMGRAFYPYCEMQVRTKSCAFHQRPAEPAVRQVVGNVLHVQQLVDASAAFRTCPHKVALEAARQADILVCDYNYVFSDLQETILGRLERSLDDLVLIVDEAHNLPDRIRSHLCLDLSLLDLHVAVKEAKAVDPEAAHQLGGLIRVLAPFLGSVRGERRLDRGEFLDLVERALTPGLDGAVSYADLVLLCDRAAEEVLRRGQTTVLTDVARFLRYWSDAGEATLRFALGGSEGKVGLRLLDPAELSRDVFRSVHASILMSGTLHPVEMFADLLGIEESRRWLRSYPSPFPSRNRLLVVDPDVSTAYFRRTKAMYARIADRIAAVAHAARGNVAAFFPSYEFLGSVVEPLRRRRLEQRLLVEKPSWDKGQREAALERLRLARPGPGILLLGVLGGSLSEGTDYENNLLRMAVVVGLPLAPPNLEVEALRTYYARRFGVERGHDYAVVFPAVNRVLQAAGRVIRSERDRGAVVLLEGRLLEPRYRRCFPEDFDFRSTRNVAKEVRTFFYAPQNGLARAAEARG